MTPPHKLAGKLAPKNILIDPQKIIEAYYSKKPDPSRPEEQVAFGTSGHRGSSNIGSFNENHILAITQAICDYRKSKHYTGPLFIGMDTHALSAPALKTALEVLAANEILTLRQPEESFTPTPVISYAILTYNQGKSSGLADGIVITPSHNPPGDGGFKYNPPHGGPADTDCTKVIENRANEILRENLKSIRRISYERALRSSCVKEWDFCTPYINDLASVIDLEVIAQSKLRMAVDPLGGAAVYYWEKIAKKYGLNLQVVNSKVDPTFSFMTVDKDGKIRMDCSSPDAMAGLIGLKDQYDISFGNDPDTDRHGIVTRSSGLLNPNHYLAVAIEYLFRNRPHWKKTSAIGKTLVSSAMIDRVAHSLHRTLKEVPVGFKWFVEGLMDGNYGFGGEESAGASFLRKDGSVWTTDKDGIILNLLSAEITAKTKKDPGLLYRELEERFGSPLYERMDAAANSAQKKLLSHLSPEQVTANTLAGEPILAKLTRAPGNNAPIGGLKVVTEQGWFAARPSGTEDIYKIYAESFKGKEHLKLIQKEAQQLVDSVISQQMKSI